MIALREDCLLMEGPEGTYLPCSVDQLMLEFVGNATELLDADMLKHAAAGVLHYFKHDQGRQFVSVGEFARALAKVLSSLGLAAEVTEVCEVAPIPSADLRAIASSAGKLGELEFFSRLRAVLKEQLAGSPRRVEFRGLRGCVKQLSGRKRWCPECDRLEAWIIEQLRGWYQQQPEARNTAMIVR